MASRDIPAAITNRLANDQQQIAYAVLCINIEKWYVKSSQFAREILEYYFDRIGETDT